MVMFLVFLVAAVVFLFIGKIGSPSPTDRVSHPAPEIYASVRRAQATTRSHRGGSGKNSVARGTGAGRGIPSSSKYIR